MDKEVKNESDRADEAMSDKGIKNKNWIAQKICDGESTLMKVEAGAMKNRMQNNLRQRKTNKSKNNKLEHSKNMNYQRTLREQRYPNKKIQRLAKARAYFKKWKAKKDIEAQNMVEFSKIIENNQKLESSSINYLEGIQETQKSIEQEYLKNREERVRLEKVRTQLKDEQEELELERAQLVIREKVVKAREQELELIEIQMIRDKNLQDKRI